MKVEVEVAGGRTRGSRGGAGAGRVEAVVEVEVAGAGHVEEKVEVIVAGKGAWKWI
jgi:hypothetical protein